MDHGLLAVDAQPSTLEQPASATQPGLEDVVYEIGISEPLMSFVAETSADGSQPAPALHHEALDPAIFAGLLAP